MSTSSPCKPAWFRIAQKIYIINRKLKFKASNDINDTNIQCCK